LNADKPAAVLGDEDIQVGVEDLALDALHLVRSAV
jgi:hypothetical protein